VGCGESLGRLHRSQSPHISHPVSEAVPIELVWGYQSLQDALGEASLFEKRRASDGSNLILVRRSGLRGKPLGGTRASSPTNPYGTRSANSTSDSVQVIVRNSTVAEAWSGARDGGARSTTFSVADGRGAT
jgi:hypothetical protein